MIAVNLEDKFTKFADQWSPKIVAQLNDHVVKLAKVAGEFVWHKHDNADELFLVHRGSLVIRFRDREVTLLAGELFVVPSGVEHQPVADEECEILLIEPTEAVNTGDAGGELTVTDEEWI